ncbi:MAG: exodeoxyribonuclease VII large subunit [Myxococcota bacterium]
MPQLPFTFRSQVREQPDPHPPDGEDDVDNATGSPEDKGNPEPADAPSSGGSSERLILTVGQLVRGLDDAVSAGPNVWVSGEIAQWRPHGSGQIYFTLKDAEARLDCVVWRSHRPRIRFSPREGMEVHVLGRPGIYPKQGRLQFTVFTLEPRGVGALHAELQARMDKLRSEGLTDPSRKRRLPMLPSIIGVVTSTDGAALQDVLRTIWRRDPKAHVRVSSTPVQGPKAHHRVVTALRRLDRSGCDVILLVRGGGSIEDLWSFNQEALARAIADCRVPVVTGIGHETDTTLSDLVADLRSSTPTAAAEAAVPIRSELRFGFSRLEQRLHRASLGEMGRHRARVEILLRRLSAPDRLIHRNRQDLDDALTRMQAGWHRRIRNLRTLHDQIQSRLHAAAPKRRIQGLGRRIDRAEPRLDAAMARHLAEHRQRLAVAMSRLESLSPLSVLSRGYSLVHTDQGRLVRSVSDLSPGDRVRVQLSEGRFSARVASVESEKGRS